MAACIFVWLIWAPQQTPRYPRGTVGLPIGHPQTSNGHSYASQWKPIGPRLETHGKSKGPSGDAQEFPWAPNGHIVIPMGSTIPKDCHGGTYRVSIGMPSESISQANNTCS